MTSLIAAVGSGRSPSFIPAVPAAWSVTTIAFMTIFSSVSLCLVFSADQCAWAFIGWPPQADRRGALNQLVLPACPADTLVWSGRIGYLGSNQRTSHEARVLQPLHRLRPLPLRRGHVRDRLPGVLG